MAYNPIIADIFINVKEIKLNNYAALKGGYDNIYHFQIYIILLLVCFNKNFERSTLQK